MPLRPPPGRAGRPWLLRRLGVARRGADVLEQKRRALHRQQRRLRELRAQARAEWEQRAREAETWWSRAAVLGGERSLELAHLDGIEPAAVRLEWRNSLGVVYPAEADVELPHGEPASPGGSAALTFAAAAYRRALEAAAHVGAAERALALTDAELAATARRLRAIERRWIPEHERALARLELVLDETEREDTARVRWVIRRAGRRD